MIKFTTYMTILVYYLFLNLYITFFVVKKREKVGHAMRKKILNAGGKGQTRCSETNKKISVKGRDFLRTQFQMYDLVLQGKVWCHELWQQADSEKEGGRDLRIRGTSTGMGEGKRGQLRTSETPRLTRRYMTNRRTDMGQADSLGRERNNVVVWEATYQARRGRNEWLKLGMTGHTKKGWILTH